MTPSGGERKDIRAEDSSPMIEGTPVGSVFGFDRVFLAEAALAAERAGDAHSRGQGAPAVAGATAACVLCSAAACEARLSEYITYQEEKGGLSSEVIEEIRNWRLEVVERWKMLLSRVAPEFDPRTSSEYQAFDCLLDLRNIVAHRNARARPFGSWPKHLDHCVKKKVIPVKQGQYLEWTSSTYIHSVARWAHQTAREWLEFVERFGVSIPT